MREIYQVIISDGNRNTISRTVECCEDHLWSVNTNDGTEKVMTTKALLETGAVAKLGGRGRFFINKTPVELWLEHYVSEHYNETEIELLGSEVFRNFDNYRQSCKFKFEITLTKLIMSLYNFKLDGIRKGRKTNRGNTIIFDIQLLKKHFNLNNLIDIDDFDEDEGGTENDDISNNSN
jgi:hypothetical protein